MNLHRYDLKLPLPELIREAQSAIEGWDWRRGAYGHALSLPAYGDLHPYSRYSYQNHPSAGLLGRLPLMQEIFTSMRCDKVSFRLLRRAPRSSYAWHTDQWKGPGVVRFQIPILSDARAFLVLTDYDSSDELREAASWNRTEETFEPFALANTGRVQKHHLEPGVLHYFDTSHVHTLVNPGPSERITLSFDLAANDWLRERFPAIRAEIGDGPIRALPRPGRLRNGLAFASSRVHPLRNLARQWLRDRERHAARPR